MKVYDLLILDISHSEIKIIEKTYDVKEFDTGYKVVNSSLRYNFDKCLENVPVQTFTGFEIYTTDKNKIEENKKKLYETTQMYLLNVL